MDQRGNLTMIWEDEPWEVWIPAEHLHGQAHVRL